MDYNLGKFKLKSTSKVYYRLFGFIDIYLFDIQSKHYLNKNGKRGRLAIFHEIVDGELKINTE